MYLQAYILIKKEMFPWNVNLYLNKKFHTPNVKIDDFIMFLYKIIFIDKNWKNVVD